MRANNITSKIILSLVLFLVVAAASAMAADGVVEGGGKCDAENADGSCDVAEASTTGSGGIALQCEDKDPRCGDWASEGECQKNPVYMLGEL